MDQSIRVLNKVVAWLWKTSAGHETYTCLVSADFALLDDELKGAPARVLLAFWGFFKETDILEDVLLLGSRFLLRSN